MNTWENGKETESAPDIVTAAPVTELLHTPEMVAAAWPGGQELAAQVENRASIVTQLDEITEKLPDPETSLETAVESGLVGAGQAADLYDSLGGLLRDPEYRRLLLYLPFGFMPRAAWHPADENLKESVESFKSAYMDAWFGLLAYKDVRANFIDGDVLEEELRTGDLPRVVKAAHLVPLLIDRGYLSKEAALQLREDAANVVLRDSLAEGLGAYLEAAGEEFDGVDLSREERRVQDPAAVSERRKVWLAQEGREAAIAVAARHIARTLGKNTLGDMLDLLSGGNKELAAHMLAEGIYRGAERVTATDTAELLNDYTEILNDLWEQGDTDLRDRLEAIYHRLRRLGAISLSELTQKGIALPDLGGDWSENFKRMPAIEADMQRFAAGVADHPELSGLIYPVALVGGSRLKGYGGQTSDVDVSIIVKAGTPEAARDQIRELIASCMGGSARYEVTEIWLDETEDGQLQVHDFPQTISHTANSQAAHMIFDTVWVGDANAIRELQRKLLPGYFYMDNDPAAKDERRLHLEKLEQDALQYRLLHRGYAKHYPLRERAESWTQSRLIDGGSAFWDSGFRMQAARRFVRNVFLPQFIKK